MKTKGNYLPKSFFRNNPLMEYSAAAIAHFVITERPTAKLEQTILDITENSIDDGRKERIRQERQSIEQTDDPAVLVEIMRKGCDVFNQQLLCTKVLDLHEQTMPLLLRRYRTCALAVSYTHLTLPTKA